MPAPPGRSAGAQLLGGDETESEDDGKDYEFLHAGENSSRDKGPSPLCLTDQRSGAFDREGGTFFMRAAAIMKAIVTRSAPVRKARV